MMERRKKEWDDQQWQRIESEFGEPIRDVIVGLHYEMRIPLCAVAGVVGIDQWVLRRWCKLLDIKTRSRGYRKIDTPGKVQLQARALGYDSVPQAICDMRAGGLRWEDICRKLECAESTICRYMPESAKGYHNITDEGREAKRENARKLNERLNSGELQRGGFAKISLDYVQPQRAYDTGSRV